jgi:hypothetical protein
MASVFKQYLALYKSMRGSFKEYLETKLSNIIWRGQAGTEISCQEKLE